MNQVEKWGVFETSFTAQSEGNPYQDVEFGAVFTCADQQVRVPGFYDGANRFVLRYMPRAEGEHRFVSYSNVSALDGLTGAFTCTPAAEGNHGMVQIRNQYHFAYEDGTPYYPFGTTSYGWTHQPEEIAQGTLAELKKGYFNKIRMCVLPHYSKHSAQVTEVFPFVRRADGTFDYDQINPAYYRMFEKRIQALMKMNVEADLIFFHPYCRQWGMMEIPQPQRIHFVRYTTARFAAYRNVWWSMANEYDYIPAIQDEDWDAIGWEIYNTDAYKHLLSNHNAQRFYPYWKPYITHACLQDGLAMMHLPRATALRYAWEKAVIYDEVCYEGNVDRFRWGNLDGKTMVDRFYRALAAGTYCGHGEIIVDENVEHVWTGIGQKLKGESGPRIAFLHKLMAERIGCLTPIDTWWRADFAKNGGLYYRYIGMDAPAEVPFELAGEYGCEDVENGAQYKVTVIDGWNMTVQELDTVYTVKQVDDYTCMDADHKTIPLPEHQLVVLLCKRIQ